jgi:hypothetical protein
VINLEATALISSSENVISIKKLTQIYQIMSFNALF